MDHQIVTKLVESRLQIEDRHINYAEGPQNGPPLLLIHGISGRWQDWNSVLDLFAENWHVFAIDLRGHGKSSWVQDGYHWRNYVLDQVQFIERVVESPMFVVGHSLGGAIAIGLNAERSDLVTAAVYEDPPLFLHRRWQGNAFRDSFSAILGVLDTKPDIETVVAHLKDANPEMDDESCRERAKKLLAMDPDVFRSTLSGRARANYRTEDILARAASPGLLLQAEPWLGSALNDEEAAEAMTIFPNAQHEKWDDSGHGMHASFPERFHQRVMSFFAPYLDA